MFYIYLKAYRQREEYKAAVWRFQANTAAWIQGQYIARAIGHCFGEEKSQYPEKPIQIFKTADEDSKEEEEITEQVSPDNAIRAQTERIDRLLAQKAQQPKEVVGERRN